ncbi:phage/plasmid primase, P4 family [Bradyrhizobium barranii subsp. barranii]|uniref:Bifunctional DNA primase/polymerase n=1 Tax=Bradyrhizobium barranii subsp. barranii TaxID=2823807 RepID=A0A939MCK4_9BRAD|nr:phage/plasmid primase, P4 family [Bradyrhizobium barranii]UEM09032.1 phage/plasmid primase, P4 family [Bradyrhizobium barranii subsp. barranii]
MSILDHALAYAVRGWPVFPCHPKTKQPLVKSDVEGEGGYKLATIEADTIRAWWKRWPRAMIGFSPGAIGVFVVDFDAGEDKKTGEIFEAAGLQLALEGAIGGLLPATLFTRTPRGGVHLWFQKPDDVDEILNRSNLLGPQSKTDIRGDNGYVVLPPSLRDDGVAYAWGGDAETAIAPAPAALVNLVLRRGAFEEKPAQGPGIGARAAAGVKPPAGKGDGAIAAGDDAVRRYCLSALDAELQGVRNAGQGGRNDALNIASLKLAQFVAAGGLNESFVRASLENAAADCGLIRDDGLRAVKATIESGFRKGRTQPRDFDEIRRQAADRQSRPRGRGQSGSVTRDDGRREDADAADRMASSRRSPSAGAARPSDDSNPPDSSFAPAPPPGTNGKPSSQTGAARVSAGGWGTGGEPPNPPAETSEARNMRLAFFPLTDLGNAERFRERYKDRLLWCPAIGWLSWDGRRWSREGAEELVKIAEHDTVRMIQEEAKELKASGCKDDKDAPRGARDFVFKVDRDGNKTFYSEKVASWGRSSEAVNKLGALSKRGAPYFAVSIDKLDADKMKINVRNGTLVIAKREDADYVDFRPHDPADMITKLAPVDFDPAAERSVFDSFLARVQPQAEMRAFLQQWLGVSLTGVTEQLLAFLYGKGSNGKSVLMDAVSYVAGDYGETVPIETFLDHGKSRGAGQATPDLAILPGVRMLRTSEPEKGAKLAEALVKLVTGGEPIQARHLNRDFFKFYPQFKLTMSGNYRPTISGTDEGIWRRVRLVPFGVTIPKEERDIHLGDKLRAEASGILNWLLDGLRVWLDKGLQEPAEVVEATAEYRSASDPLGRFLAACVVDSIGDRVQSSVLHQVYEAWCKASGENAWKNRGLSLALQERGYKSKQSNVMWFLDIKLTKSVNDFVDHEGNPLRMRADGEKEAVDAGDVEI